MENESQIIEGNETVPEAAPATEDGSRWPVVITLVALLVWFGFQAVQLVRERGNLSAVKTNQEMAIQESHKVRSQFESIVTKITELADQGHAGAKAVVDELQRRGLAMQPEAKPDK